MDPLAPLAEHWRVREGNFSTLIFVHSIIVLFFCTRITNNLYRANNADREEIFCWAKYEARIANKILGNMIMYEDRKEKLMLSNNM